MMELGAYNGGVFLHREVVDMRKSIDGLSAIVVEGMGQDLFSRSLFVFINRRRDKLKILYFDRTGFALWYKRLEGEKFCWPRKLDVAVVELDAKKLSMLLEGIDIWKMRPHETLKHSQVF